MKPSLLLIVLLSVLKVQTSVADVTLNYSLSQDGKDNQTASYQVRQQQLRLTDSLSGRINLYDSRSQQFVSQQKGSKQVSILNKEILDKRVSELNQKRMQKLDETEKKLQLRMKSLGQKEKEVGVGVINQLKYPELYGEHLLLKTYPTDRTKTIKGIECQVIQLKREAMLLKEFCMASRGDVDMSKSDYETLRSFYIFDYTAQSRIMLAMGRSKFDIIDFDKYDMPGVVIEMISFVDDKPQLQMRLTKVNDDSLDPELFKLSTSEPPTTPAKNP